VNNRSRNILLVLIIAAVIAIVLGVRNTSSNSKELIASELVAHINAGQVKTIEVSDEGKLTITYTNNDTRKTQINSNAQDVIQVLESLGASKDILEGKQPNADGKALEVKFTKPSNWFTWIGVIGTFLPLLLIGGFIYLMLRQAQGSNNQALVRQEPCPHVHG
jgi:cell division protease FtsH